MKNYPASLNGWKGFLRDQKMLLLCGATPGSDLSDMKDPGFDIDRQSKMVSAEFLSALAFLELAILALDRATIIECEENDS